MMKGSGPKVTILDIVGKKPQGDDSGGDAGMMAKKALWKAIQGNDFDAFSEALDEWYANCEGGKESEPDSDVDDSMK